MRTLPLEPAREGREENEKMKTIHDVASEMDRLFPDQVDREPCEWGHGYMAGHIGP